MYTIGDIIRNRRLELRHSQESLCFNICTQGTLSKIENGEFTPSRSVFEAIMERLDFPPEKYPSFVSKNEHRTYELRHDIRRCIAYNDFKKAGELVAQFDNEAEVSAIYSQFSAYVKALILNTGPGKTEESLRMLESALEMTCPGFDVANIEKRLFFLDETKIVYNIALHYHELGNNDDALSIMSSLAAYTEKRQINYSAKASALVLMYYALSKLYGIKGECLKSIHEADKGIELCLKYGLLFTFPYLLFQKGYNMLETGGQQDCAVKCIREAYFIFESMRQPETMQLIKGDLSKRNLSVLRHFSYG